MRGAVNPRVLNALLVLLAFIAVALPGTVLAARIAVVADEDLTVYRSVITGFSIEARAEIDEYNLRGDPALGARIAAEIAARKPDVLVAVGPRSANLLRQKFQKLPLVHCMVPNVAAYDLTAPNITGVALEPALAEQLGALKALVPTVKRLGVVFDPSHTAARVREISEVAAGMGLTVTAQEVKAPDEVPAALKKLGALGVDAVWTPADSTVLTLQGIDALAEFSRAQKVPVYGINANHVQRGALATLALDYPSVGRQVGRACNRVLAQGDAARGPALQAPEGLDLAVNLTVAQRLGIAEALGTAALQVAAERGYAVRVFR